MSKFLESNTSAFAPGRARRAPRVCLSRIGGSLVAGVALALAAMSPGSASAAEFKVGFIMSLTGPSGELGKVTLEGAQAGIEMVNSTGGILRSWPSR